MAQSGRPPTRILSEPADLNTQTKRGKPDHIKRKQCLRLKESQNQANHHKHGHGHYHLTFDVILHGYACVVTTMETFQVKPKLSIV